MKQGRLRRTLRVLARADELCPGTRADGDALRSAALEALAPGGWSGSELYHLASERAAAGHAAEAQRLRDRALRALEQETGAKLSVDLPFVEPPVAAGFAASGDGRMAAFARAAHVHVIDLGTGSERLRLPATATGSQAAPFTAVAFSTNGERVAAVTDTHLQIWDSRTGAPITDFAVGDSYQGLAFTSDGASLWLRAEEHLDRWNIAPPRMTQTVGRAVQLVRGDARGDLRPTHLATRLRPSTDAVAQPFTSLDLLDADTGRVLRTLRDLPSATHAIGLSEDGRFAAVEVVIDGTSEVAIEVRSSRTGRLVRRMDAADGGICGVLRFSPDGSMLLATEEGVTRIWSVATGRLLRACHACAGGDAFLGRQLLLPNAESSRVWDPVTNTSWLDAGRMPGRDPEHHGAVVPSLAFDLLYTEHALQRPVWTPDGKLVAREYSLPDGVSIVTTPAGHLEVLGRTTWQPLCRIGVRTCSRRFSRSPPTSCRRRAASRASGSSASRASCPWR
ncbi:MAG: hypothetical protein HY908_20035 [Myxococcales bacterium]|nr:hypothetical protein [Myxococcales bacterium]